MTSVQQFDFSVDVLRALLWQYEGAEGLQSILRAKADWYETNQAQFWSDWYRDVFNLQTASDLGLRVWGIILGVDLSIDQPSTGARPVFGFGDNNQNFTNGGFGRDGTGTAALTVEQKRLVLRMRYYQLVSDGSVPFTNYILREVFGSGYVLDQLDMTARYVFPTALPSSVLTVLQEFDLLPRPAGVGVEVLIDPSSAFGFDPVYLNFNHGTFAS